MLRQARQRLGERIFQDDEGFAQAGGGKRVAQNQVVRRKNIFGEENAQLPADLNGALDDRHDFNLNARRIFTRINLFWLFQSPMKSRRLLQIARSNWMRLGLVNWFIFHWLTLAVSGSKLAGFACVFSTFCKEFSSVGGSSSSPNNSGMTFSSGIRMQ